MRARTVAWRRATAALLAAALVAGCGATVTGRAIPVDDAAPVLGPAGSTGSPSPPAGTSSGSASAADVISPRSSRTGEPGGPSGSGVTTAPSTARAVPAPSTPSTGRPTLGGPSGAQTPAQPSVPATVDVSALLRSLTAAMDAHDRAGFLRHFAPDTTAVAARWWDNLDVIGFDAGSVATYGDSGHVLRLDAHRNATVGNVMAGAHQKWDGVDAHGTPVIGTTQYRMTVRWQADGSLRIIGWQAVRPAPWDCECTLVATRRPGVLVVTRPSATGYAAKVADEAVHALQFQRQMLVGLGSDLQPLDGAVIFATDDADDLRRWFRTADDATTDVTDIALAYVRDLQTAYGNKHPAGRSVGSSRLVAGPMAANLLRSVLIHELWHYLMFDHPVDRHWLSEHPGIAEGMAQYVTELYFGSPPDTIGTEQMRPDRGYYAGAMTTERLQQLFTGRPPTAQQLRFGPAEEIDFWYVIAASMFGYLAQRFSIGAALDAGVCAYTGRTVFDCAAGTADAGVSANRLRQQWADWVRRTYG